MDGGHGEHKPDRPDLLVTIFEHITGVERRLDTVSHQLEKLDGDKAILKRLDKMDAKLDALLAASGGAIPQEVLDKLKATASAAEAQADVAKTLAEKGQE